MESRPPVERDLSSDERDRSADERDKTSEDRDREAEARDRAALDRDRAADTLEAEPIEGPRSEPERRTRSFGRRKTDISPGLARASAASDRAEAASDRKAAELGREKGARDRSGASDDRVAASVDRDASARDRAASSVDELTGAYRRGTGLVELEREMMRAKRTGHPFVVAFLDVDGLKMINDSLGHDAGDQLLRRVVDCTRSQLRSYDLIVRFGGDEFVCGLSNLRHREATERFRRIDEILAENDSSITVGLAELEENDSLVELIARADKALYESETGKSRE
jgi:diguanylate cyclase (GGDEF)-like protein